MNVNAAATSEKEPAQTDQQVHNDDHSILDPQYDTAPSSDTSSRPSSTLSTHSAPATLSEAREILHDNQDPDFKIPLVGQPYSLPEPHRWENVPKWQWKNTLRRQPLSSMRPAMWYAGRATRPLVLTFDAFDTLFHPAEPVAKQYRDVASRWNLDFAESDILQSFKKAFKAMNEQFPNYGKALDMDPSAWWSRLIHDTLSPLLPNDVHELPLDLSTELYNRFSSSEGYELFPDVIPFLSLIGSSSWSAGVWAPRRTMLGIISNSDPRVRSILSSFGIAISPSLFPPRFSHTHRFWHFHDYGPANFAFATLSYDAGFSKPDRQIFDAAVRDSQAALGEMHPVGRLSRTGNEVYEDAHSSFHYMHVGDDMEKDVLPAMDCGWDAILLDREAEQAIQIKEIQGKQVTVINNLMVLRQVVTKERLEQNGGQQPVWLDEAKGTVRHEYVRRKNLKGRRLYRHPQAPQDTQWKILI